MHALPQDITIHCPAKLNLFLHITAQRNDGYHELETLFQFIDLCDDLHISATTDGRIDLLTPLQDVSHEDNLVYRAAMLLMPLRKDAQQGAQISLHKRIPMGGGLGGGSSNAASTLIGLNQLWGLGLDRRQLADLGIQLGADVPVFIFGQAAFARGVGEQLVAVEPAPAWYLVVHPQVHVSTASVFQHPDLPRNSAPITTELSEWASHRNDCQSLVASLYPPVAKAIDWLVEYAPTRMTGTGACVFGCFDSQAAAQKALAAMPSAFSGFVAQGLNTSPAWQGL
ncbi:4-(cytidine 5'-diphospho)-2-C-methyl-D-erythritol kinase [Aliidiomarina maris]|uniref:4-diphosphocytidyl-2-C-methyl-D-erythritol kinase n=1 Tax=Aliidiomarina maris TaxID=531312 RepID=A0A327WS78_9GAMM|nr:4-(cytidine 5'-diphospho)-2-C-methyl-D-erythritol kinase [Aliidiomarina maris]MCL5050074.1 4-(cytidine 5'-diphospho)-2-C-methyl-D-erythritol kinase [Bacillota bacterium]RAJ93696.1 4-diphosphocytidyl-2-C-methyl-D-erythritol kinase [Aliidiomarina maris]RUO19413.1 4-(cytidine 5'-diphospho)-2-C-methyl-D-erythritol kinase [Aliidiomarina maris]